MSVVLTPSDVHCMGQGAGEMSMPDSDLHVRCHTMKYADLHVPDT